MRRWRPCGPRSTACSGSSTDWEAENLRLREANPEARESLDQLDRTKSEAAELADGVQELERKLGVDRGRRN